MATYNPTWINKAMYIDGRPADSQRIEFIVVLHFDLFFLFPISFCSIELLLARKLPLKSLLRVSTSLPPSLMHHVFWTFFVLDVRIQDHPAPL